MQDEQLKMFLLFKLELGPVALKEKKKTACLAWTPCHASHNFAQLRTWSQASHSDDVTAASGDTKSPRWQHTAPHDSTLSTSFRLPQNTGRSKKYASPEEEAQHECHRVAAREHRRWLQSNWKYQAEAGASKRQRRAEDPEDRALYVEYKWNCWKNDTALRVMENFQHQARKSMGGANLAKPEGTRSTPRSTVSPALHQ